MRGVFLWMAALLIGACGNETRGTLTQRAEGPGLVALPDGALRPDDTGDGPDADTTDTTDTLAGDSGPDLVEPTDTTETDVSLPDAGDTLRDTEGDVPTGDVTPPACEGDEDCPDSSCNSGRCQAGACVTIPLDAGSCDDGDACTTEDRCSAGRCQGTGTRTCSDGDPCTSDRCDPALGCMTSPTSCDDENACTTDTCVANIGCVFSPIPCPASTVACVASACDPALGCITTPAGDGTPCNDANPCTTADACTQGLCAGTRQTCDDNNACTTDACIDGGCLSLPIPGCATDPQCAGRNAGSTCDDGQSSTAADMCILGKCAGFALTRIAGTTIANQQGLVLLEVDFASDAWWALYWMLDGSLDQSFALGRITNPAGPALIAATLQAEPFVGLRDGFAGDAAGRIWRFANDAWTNDSGWDEALKTSERGIVTHLWTARDLSATGTPGTRHLWAVGESDGVEWLRYCVDGSNTVTCEAQELDDFDDSSIPQALAGTPLCDATGACEGFELILGADAWAGGSFYNDTYENADGTASLWAQGRIPENAANRTTEAVIGWGSSADAQYLVAGTNGYLVHRRIDGAWSNPLSLKEGQSNRDFYGAWEGAGVVVLAASRPVSGSQLAYELWVAPSDANVESGGSWTIHELTRAPAVNAAGLYDVHGRPSGEMRAVGALRRASGASDWLDGAVWVRTP
jgi:hypothetical protein